MEVGEQLRALEEKLHELESDIRKLKYDVQQLNYYKANEHHTHPEYEKRG